MRFFSSAVAVVATGCLAACASPTSATTEQTESASVSDVVSMSRRSDGRFDVLCRGASGGPSRSEIDTEAQVLQNQVCLPLPPPPPGGHVVHGADRNIPLGDGLTDVQVEQWGRNLWEGYASFTVALVGAEAIRLDNARLVDATGASYPLTTSPTSYARLPLPVSLLATTDRSVTTTVSITNVAFEVTRTNAIPGQGLSGVFNGVNAGAVGTLGADIPGVAMTFSGSARFYRNFTNGNDCGRLNVTDRTGRVVVFAPTATEQQVSLVAPLQITSNAACVSSRIASQEDPSRDFALSLSSITLGDPQ